MMTVASHGTVGWNYVTLDLTATAVSEQLSFLAWGDNGNTTDLPPDGVPFRRQFAGRFRDTGTSDLGDDGPRLPRAGRRSLGSARCSSDDRAGLSSTLSLFG